MLEILSAEPPVLVSVKDCESLVDPVFTVPNERLVSDSETAGALTPVPLSAIVCVALPALSTIVMSAVIASVLAGEK